MKVRLAHAVLTVCLVLAITCCFERPAYAYIDPGSGILACQALAAFFTGALFYLRKNIRKLFRSFGMPATDSRSSFRIDHSDR